MDSRLLWKILAFHCTLCSPDVPAPLINISDYERERANIITERVLQERDHLVEQAWHEKQNDKKAQLEARVTRFSAVLPLAESYVQDLITIPKELIFSY